MRCSVLSHIAKISMTQTHVLLPRPTAANWANAATCNLCHELLRHVRTCQDWLQTHRTQWTTTTIPIRILFEQTSYTINVCMSVQWKTPDDGQRNCPKHAEIYSKNKFGKISSRGWFYYKNINICRLLLFIVYVDKMRVLFTVSICVWVRNNEQIFRGARSTIKYKSTVLTQ